MVETKSGKKIIVEADLKAWEQALQQAYNRKAKIEVELSATSFYLLDPLDVRSFIAA